MANKKKNNIGKDFKNSDPHQRVKLLKWIFFSLLTLDIILIALTPRFISNGVGFIEKEEDVEGILIIILFVVGYVIYYFYKRELEKSLRQIEEHEMRNKTMEERLDGAIKHIGSLNVQIQEIRSIFSDLNKYPESKQDFKLVVEFLAKKILSLVSAEWVLIRIIDPLTLKTLKDHNQTRGSYILLKHQISNEELVNKRDEIKEFSVVESEPSGLSLRVFCIFPRSNLTQEQKVLLKAVANQLELIYLIFASNYYKNSHTVSAADDL